MSDSGATILIGLLALALIILVWQLFRQIAQRRQLCYWLQDPQREIPDGSGAWREIFSLLQRMRKEELRERRALDDSLSRFHQAAQALPDGVVLLDANGHIEWLNGAASIHLGLDASRDNGVMVEQMLRQTSFLQLLRGFRAGETVKPLTLQVDASGERRTLSILLLSFADTSTLLLSRDISEIARAESMRRDFIANISHELRTPLTVISGFLEQLTTEPMPAPDTAKGFLTLMTEQTQRMNRLVADLLTLSRLESTAEPPRDDSVDVPALVSLLAEEAQALSHGRHLVELTYVASCKLRGSYDEVRSAFGNLVSNAIRYTPAGGKISIAWECEGPQMRFSVSDTGIGIPAEHIPRLTERFYRVDKGRSTNTGGTGLGLAIVKHVLVRHQGSLVIQSKVGQGSTFAVTLPAERRIDI